MRSLHCAMNDETVRCFGRDDDFVGGLVVCDGGLGLVGEVVVEEFVAGFVATFDLEEDFGVAFVGEVGGAGEVQEAP